MELRLSKTVVLLLAVVSSCASEILAHEPAVNVSAAGADTVTGSGERTVFTLLLMVPLTNRSTMEGYRAPWDRGLEIRPAAKLAEQQINQHPHLLPDATLEVRVVDIEPCATDRFAANIQALVPFAEISSNSSSSVLGMVGGPFCPDLLMKLVSPLASREESRVFQLLGSTAKAAQKASKPKVHFITPSVELYYETVYAMMGVFNWSKIYIIAETFFDGLRTVRGVGNLNITFRQFFTSSPSLFRDLRQSEKNIIFASLSPQHAGEVLCRAHRESLLYPDYVWIFHDLTPEVILENYQGGCDTDTLEGTLHGNFFLQFPFAPRSPDTTLVSGDTYSEHLLMLDPVNPYANVVYDTIWATSLALNRSLSLSGKPLSHYQNREGKRALIDAMDSVLPDIAFEGASGSINFNKSEGVVVNDAVDISLYYNGSLEPVTTYHSETQLSIPKSIVAEVPRDTLSTTYTLIPVWITGILAASMVCCLLLTTAVLVLFVHYREDPDIKATSPSLSYLMFLGCYLLLFSTLVHTLRGAVAVRGVGAVMLCGTVVTGDSLGVNLIFTTLLLRMLRVYRIFSHFGKTGKIWSNRNMACIVGVVLLGDVVLILVWSLIDTYMILDTVKFQYDARPPHYEVQQLCHSERLSLWLGTLLGKLGILFTIVLFLAIKTRKIRKSNFKDTKKVNMYIFSTIVIVITFMTLFFLFVSTENTLAAHLMVYLAFGVTALLCQLFLFVPKVMSPLLKKYGYEVNYNHITGKKRLRKRSTAISAITLRNTQFAKVHL